MLVEVSDLTYRAGDRTLLSLASLRIEAGEHRLVLGPSGSGKTTLINLLAGLITPTTGSVIIDGRSMSAAGPAARDRLRRETIGMVFQTLRLVSALSVRQNLALAQTLSRGGSDAAEIDHLIGLIGLSHRADAKPRELSQGEGQRAAIARALCARPALLLADEPTSALDAANATTMVELMLAAAAQTGTTLLIATHDGRIRPHFDRVLDLTPEAVAA